MKGEIILKCILQGQLQDIGVKTVNGLSSNVVLTGANINISSSDTTKLNVGLANKLSVPQLIPDGTDLNTVTAPGMYYSENTNIPNAPNNDSAFSLLVENTGAWGGRARKQTYTPYNKNIVLTRILTFSYGDGLEQVWFPWVQLATATPPQAYNLPLEDGIESNSGTQPAYFIDQFGIVTVSLSVYGVNTLASGTVIAQLPEGFRPGSPNTICAAPNAFLAFDPPGSIILYTDNGQPVEANKWIVANVRFLASGNQGWNT